MAITLLCADELPDGAPAQVRATLDRLQAECQPDRDLLAQSDTTGTDALPQTQLARDIVAAAQRISAAAKAAPTAALTTAPALDAAILDRALGDAAAASAPARFGIAQRRAIAYARTAQARFPTAQAPDAMAFELLRSLDPSLAVNRASGGEMGGVAVATAAAGGLEAVGVVARSASMAHLCASAVAGAVLAPEGELSAEVVWDVLSSGARAAAALRTAGHLRAAVLTFRGRGRVIGPLDGDRLLRFGVSSWR